MTNTERQFMNSCGGQMIFVGRNRKEHSFKISNNLSYTPDFFDQQTGVYYEVKSSRGAYLASRRILEAFIVKFPNVRLEVVTPQGEDASSAWPYAVNKNGRVIGTGLNRRNRRPLFPLTHYSTSQAEQIRQRLHLTTEQFSVHLGFSPNTYNAALKRGHLTQRIAREIWRRYHVSMDEMLIVSSSAL